MHRSLNWEKPGLPVAPPADLRTSPASPVLWEQYRRRHNLYSAPHRRIFEPRLITQAQLTRVRELLEDYLNSSETDTAYKIQKMYRRKLRNQFGIIIRKDGCFNTRFGKRVLHSGTHGKYLKVHGTRFYLNKRKSR